MVDMDINMEIGNWARAVGERKGEAGARGSVALRVASHHGHLGIVRYLMQSPFTVPRWEANADNSYAL